MTVQDSDRPELLTSLRVGLIQHLIHRRLTVAEAELSNAWCLATDLLEAKSRRQWMPETRIRHLLEDLDDIIGRDWSWLCSLTPDEVARRNRGRGSWNPERDAEMLRLLTEEELTLEAIGQKFGLTRERVRQIVNRQGASASVLRASRSADRRAERDRRRTAARRTTCRVCGRTFIRSRSLTCSDKCALIIKLGGRRYLDPDAYDRQRLAHARSAIRHPESHPESAVRHARAFVAAIENGRPPPPPNRRYRYRDSKLARLLEEVGRGDVLPSEIKPATETFPCAAVNNSNGKACSRKVPVEGDLCHIHLGLAGPRRQAVA